MSINATVDKRALYEIYFPAFKAAVQEGKTEAIMCAYNKLNGSYCSENKFLLTDVLKTEWKFDGFVMSDWGAVHSTENAAAEGLDLEMPGGEFFTAEKLLPLVKNGKIQETVIDDKIRRMLRVMFRMKFFESHFNKPEPNAPAQRLTALDVARSGIVLLKNEKNILPINPAHYKSVAVIGPNADVLRTGGGGSSQVVPMQSESPLDGVRRIFGKNTKIHFALGARLGGDVPSIEQRCFFLPNDSAGKNGIEAEYFNNIALTGKPTVVRIDSAINFYWNDESPAEGIEKDNFSVRWKTKLKPETTGLYELTTATDDGVRLFINGKILIDDWSD
ncbi:MAG: glycoside hydrolase family 3 C-terminal domain-containing protein, partial [Bacteroidetes bacterium]|nr:glycoside hydrolase family 3 C-terminal domain-containing protein [Bacteroidota bacterium]